MDIINLKLSERIGLGEETFSTQRRTSFLRRIQSNPIQANLTNPVQSNPIHRMESSGKPGMVHISEKTYSFLEEEYYVQKAEDLEGM